MEESENGGDEDRGEGEKEGLNFARQIKCAVSRQWLSHRPKNLDGGSERGMFFKDTQPYLLEEDPTPSLSLSRVTCNVSRDTFYPFLILPRISPFPPGARNFSGKNTI